jgi:hypothetical protein
VEKVQLREFVVCGPFSHGSLARDGFDPLLVEWLDPSQPLSEGVEVTGRRCFRAAAGAGGVLDFAALFGEGFKPFWRLKHGLAYAYAEAEVEEGRYVLLAGSEDGLAVYVNGRCALLQPIAQRFAPDFYAVPLRLSGRARLLFKVSRLAGGWRLGARLVRVEAPFYAHAARVVKPDLVRGRGERVYVSLPLVALEDIASATVRAGGGWRSSWVEVKRLRTGEEVPIALAVEPVQPPSGDEAALDLIVEAGGFREEVELKLRVVGEGEHRVETYLSRVDGSVHSYGLKPPKAAGPRGRYGLLISLHGFKGHPYFSELHGDKDWLFVVGPSARDGEVPYREVGCARGEVPRPRRGGRQGRQGRARVDRRRARLPEPPEPEALRCDRRRRERGSRGSGAQDTLHVRPRLHGLRPALARQSVGGGPRVRLLRRKVGVKPN